MKVFLVLFALVLQPLFPSEVAISYELNDGRFGDQLLCYLHAKWISYFYGVPFLYKPFLHSEHFALHEMEENLYSEEKEKNFDCIVKYVRGVVRAPIQGSLLYLTTFFSEQKDDVKIHPEWNYFPIDWNDSGFRNLLKTLFSSRKEPFIFTFPVSKKNFLTIALHIRRGGDSDPIDPHMLWPLRFPPDSYYVECLKKMSDLFPGKPIYAYLFTDDPDPESIAMKLQESLGSFPIIFDYRKEGNRHDANVIEDFFSMMQFDYLIRADSNFTFIPSLIADYKIIMTPKHHTWLIYDNDRVENHIDQIDVDIRQNN
ncbi:MAG TPA: hypothetical protein VLG49_06000 [Rhabdochlamydiaceae bacterium]|nr:hypothetical protein [Rhabdochlamydiaceae bacterium]